MIDYFQTYGVERPRFNDVRPLGVLAGEIAKVLLDRLAREESDRLTRKLRMGPDDRDILWQYANWEIWVRIGHLLQFDPGPFEGK